ncbi:MAG: hypothetical protein KGR26_09120, partial [Cyanobacteria bacterium REEB65]|nr:hypothetical protein [Cyanobacteria bacterium REEB65]
MTGRPRLTLVVGARGGVGRSVIAANLAVAMARRLKQPVILVDLDWLAGGSLASALDLEPGSHWAQVVEKGVPVSKALRDHGSGVRLLCAPPAGSAEAPTPRQIVALTAELVKISPQIVVDTTFPHLNQDAMLALYDLASPILVLTNPDIPTLAATRALLEQAKAHHVPPERLQLVLNRAGVTDDLHDEDLVEHLERPLLASVPYHPSVIVAVNRGVPLAAAAGNNPVAASIAGLAQRVLAQPQVQLPQASQSILARFAQPRLSATPDASAEASASQSTQSPP